MLAGRLAGWLAGRLGSGWGLGGSPEGVKNVYPSSKSASKTCTLRQKVGDEALKTCTLTQKVRQTHVPLGKKSSPPIVKEGARKRGQEGPGEGQGGVRNVYPSSKSASKTRTLRQKVDVEAIQLLGHQNASKTCTLSEKVGRKHVPFV